ncbi:Tad domain-containing protein [Agrococcus sp. KRD186]|uniref:Tad domain-containing protein n=1 Tax=Agrococcus sp. KRD186 TaxID=2729730 RepID=UPI0019D08053|nr:Tad domain-containing protein [Agrococcus sp. KRD186]
MKPKDDHGAIAVWVAIMLIPLLIVGALAIDLGAMHSDRQRLQYGADAAALAIAESCAIGDCDPLDLAPQETIRHTLVSKNSPLANAADSRILDLDLGSNWVEVEATSTREHWFSPAMDIDETALTAIGAASWTDAGGVFPVAFSWCELNVQGGMSPISDGDDVVGLEPVSDPQPTVIIMPKKADTGCTGTNGLIAPGNFGFLLHGECDLEVNPASGDVPGSPGNQLDQGCAEKLVQWRSDNSQPVLVPVFHGAEGAGSSVRYPLIGYAVFDLDGYYFDGSHRSEPNPCGGASRCVQGTLIDFISLGDPAAEAIVEPEVQLRLP